MSVVRTLIGNIKGPQGATGATGATGPQGDAATVNVGSVSTTAYGNAAQVTNVGTENDAILNFVIPQGKPGEKTTTMSGLTLDTVTTSADEFPVPAVSENGSTVWGKVIKFFQDTVAALTGKLDANKIVNSQAVTEAGYGLDALQANPSVSGSLAAQISDLNDSLTNTMFDLTTTISGLRGRGIYTKATKSVRLFCHGNASSNITADTVLFNVPQGYRPAGLTNGSMFFVTGSSGFGTADFHVYADGHCDQGTTNQLRTFIAVIEYPVLD